MIISLLLYNLRDCTFNDSVGQINKISFTAEIWYVFLKFRGQVKVYIWKNFFQMDVLLEPLVTICHCFFLPYPPIAAPNKLQSFFQKATYKIYFATNMMQLLWSLTKHVNAWCYILNFYQEICFKITLPDQKSDLTF